MQNLMNDLKSLFEKDDRIFAAGTLFKNKLTELTFKFDQGLLNLLLSNKKAKEHFFIEKTVKKTKVLIFDKDKFVSFVNNKEFLPDSFTAFKNKIGLIDNGDYLKEQDNVVLAWPYKDCVLEGVQDKEDQKRDEVFYNETLAPDEIDRLFEPKVLTNFKRYDNKGEHKITRLNADDNLIIRGNNLLALHCLKQKYRGKIKLIYIDPPFNTGNDEFKYNDRFKHSTWLTFMKNRLEMAREILSDDGVIFVQCDDNEQAYLKVLMDEVFKGNFINCIALKMSEASGVKMSHSIMRFPKIKEYLLFYKKNRFQGFVQIDKYKHPIWDKENNIFLDNFAKEQRNELIKIEGKEENDENDLEKAIAILKNVKKVSLTKKLKKLGIENCDKLEKWKFENSYRIIKTAGSSSLAKLVKSLPHIPNQDISAGLSKQKVLFFYITDFNWDTQQPRLQVIFADSNIYKHPCDFWQDIKTTGAIADEGGVKLGNGKKPEKLLERIIKMTTNKGDIVLDYHLGSGTTAAAAHKMARQYIGVEQLDYGKNDVISRLKNVIKGDQKGISKSVKWRRGGSFIYAELKQWNEQYMIEIQNTDTTRGLLNIYKKMKKEAFFRYDVDLSAFDEKTFEKLPLEKQKEVLCECLDKNHLYVNLSEINDATYKISSEDKKLNKQFYRPSF